MAIADATLRNDVFKSLRDYIVANKTSSANVNVEYNQKTPNKLQIVIQPITPSETFNKFGGTEGRKDINVTIYLYASTGKGLAQLTDEVSVLLKNNAIDGIDLISIDEDIATSLFNDNTYFSSTLSVLYRRE